MNNQYRLHLSLLFPIFVLGHEACGDSSSPSGTLSVDASAGLDAATTDVSVDDVETLDSSLPDTFVPDVNVPDTNIGDASVACGDLPTSFGAPVALQNATATFSQTSPGSFTIAKAIDGLTNNNLGWGISGQLAKGQAAAFETVSNTPAQAGGTRLLFVLDQTFPTEHALGRFRISYTTAARDQFADGNEGTATPGNVGADGIWNVLTPRRFCASNSANMTLLNDQSLLVEDKNSTNAIYHVEADAPVSDITGFRIEVLKDASLPVSGPGLQNSNGNFVLAEFSVRVGPR